MMGIVGCSSVGHGKGVLTKRSENTRREMPDTGDDRRQVLIRQSETLYRFVGWGRLASASFCMRLASAMLVLGIFALAPSAVRAEIRSLKLYNTHTQERETIVYKRGGKYDRAGLAKINRFMRDWRRNEPTKMDPKLLDLVWEAYRKTGSDKHIHVISGYRSPATNNALRKRSRGVARNSQHTRGKALDFYIPGVPLAKLRSIGLRAHVGGVGYYPRSGSPFVHLDTGSVRHWPRMTRKQLVKVFPKGKTLHVPSDGKPLRGYAAALAAQKLRGRSGKITIASFDDEPATPRKAKKSVGEPVVIASVSESVGIVDIRPPPPPINPLSAAPPILPRPSPIRSNQPNIPVMVATAEPLVASLQPWAEPPVIASLEANDISARQSFGSIDHWSAPPVPVELARAMAARNNSGPTSLPIYPTAVVSTIDVSRPLRAEAITTAVLSKNSGEIRDVTPLLAYAESIEIIAPPATITPVASAFSVPMPVANPLRRTVAFMPSTITGSVVPRRGGSLHLEELTLTALDTLGFRLWIGNQSTRQRQYAVLTMPDFSQIPSLIEKPEIVYSVGFTNDAYQGLRTDRFSGQLAYQPTVVDLSKSTRLALR